MIEWISVSEATPTPNKLLIIQYEFGFELGEYRIRADEYGNSYDYYIDQDCNVLRGVRRWAYVESS